MDESKGVTLNDGGNGIIFSETGTYEITVTATNDGLTDEGTFTVFVYDRIKLKGNGTEDAPYILSKPDDLYILACAVNAEIDLDGMYFSQTTDISLSKYGNWTPIGTNGIPFDGIYDGNGYKINDMSILSSQSFVGLFGFVTGTVRNVKVYGRIVATTLASPDEGPYSHTYVGGISGGINNAAVIENCENYVDILGDSMVGGIVGEIMENDYMVTKTLSAVKNCINYGKIRAITETAVYEDAMYYGGIAGRNNGIVSGCINYGSVTAVDPDCKYVGGIAGYGYLPYKDGAGPNAEAEYVAFENCSNYGSITGTYGVGGIVGQYSLKIRNCHNYADIIGESAVGGIAGIAGTSGTVDYGNNGLYESTNAGKVQCATENGGGIAGYSYCSIENCDNSGEVLGESASKLGGIVGYLSIGNIVSCNNAADGVVRGIAELGGIVGRFNMSHARISTCSNEADIVSIGSADRSVHIGGIVGMLGSFNAIADCRNDGAVVGNGSTVANGGIGGIAGSMYTDASVTGCINTGEIDGTCLAGGIVGYKASGTVSDCDNSGKVDGGADGVYIGGIAGNNVIGNIDGSTNSGAIIGKYNIGGIAGRFAQGAISSCGCLAAGSVTGEYRLGGIVGTLDTAADGQSFTVTDSTNAGAVISIVDTVSSVHIGGIVGMLGSRNAISECENTGTVTGRGNGSGSSEFGGVGGIAGSMYVSSSISAATNRGAVEGSMCVGGIVGYGKASAAGKQNLTNSENYGAVTSKAGSGNVFAGGIVGYAQYMTLTDNTTYTRPTGADGLGALGDVYGKLANSTEQNNSYVESAV